MRGLRQTDFEIMDNNVKQQVAHFSAEDAPFSLGIIYDTHGSQRERIAATLRALTNFVHALRNEDEFFLLAFNENNHFTVDFVPSADQLARQLTGDAARSATSLYDAVYLAEERLRTARNAKRVLLIISDGQDHQSRRRYDEIRARWRELNFALYAIGIAEPERDATQQRWTLDELNRRGGGSARLFSNADAAFGRATLTEMAHVSGGAAYFPDDENELALLGILTQVRRELSQQYAIGFYPIVAAQDGRWHKLRIRVRPPNSSQHYHLTYREGYQSAKSRAVSSRHGVRENSQTGVKLATRCETFRGF